MKLDTEYTCQIVKHSSATRTIIDSDPKEIVRVSQIKVKIDYQDGMLDDILVGDDNTIADSISYDSCSWGQRVGSYELIINETSLISVINKIERKNKKDNVCELLITFETADVEKAGFVGHYLRDKDNPTHITLKSIE